MAAVRWIMRTVSMPPRTAIIVSAHPWPTNFWGRPVTARVVKEISSTACSMRWLTLKRK